MRSRSLNLSETDIQLKNKASGNNSAYPRETKIDPDITLFKAGQILTKTFKNKIYNEDCIDTVKSCAYKEEKKHNHEHNFTPSSNLTPYILLTALSVHGLFEGVALGLQSKDKETLFLAIAIISHKWAESFTLGISFYKTNTDSSLYTKLIILFSLFTPIGIVAGMLLEDSNILIEAIFLSLSGGTFLYVAASEVIVEEFSVTKHKFSKYFMYLIGAIFVALLALWETLSGIDG